MGNLPVNNRGDGRKIRPGEPAGREPGRGESVQGPRQDAKGGPQGANQGGAPRGGSRVEPSHEQRRQKQDKAGQG